MALAADEDPRRLPRHRVPPQNIEAEESVLGSMMLSTEAIAEAVEILSTDDFHESAANVAPSLPGMGLRVPISGTFIQEVCPSRKA